MQSPRPERYPVEQRMSFECIQVFHPICGIFSPGFDGLMRSTSPGNQPRPGVTDTRVRVPPSVACRRRCRERRALFADTPLERVDHARLHQGRAGNRRMRRLRQHNPVSARNNFRIAGDRDRLLMPAFASGALKAFAAECRLPEP